MKHSSFQRIAFAAAAAIALAGGHSAAAAGLAATLTLSKQIAPVAVFVPDGAPALVNGMTGAQAELVDDGTFTIRSHRLPPIPGLWAVSQGGPGAGMLSLWAKTDQIELNATEIGQDTRGNPVMLCSVQVNAPRTDGAAAPNPAGALAPASLQIVQIWMLPARRGTPPPAGTGSPIQPIHSPQTGDGRSSE